MAFLYYLICKMGLHHQSYSPRVFVTREGFKLDRAWPWEDFGWEGTAVMLLLTIRVPMGLLRPVSHALLFLRASLGAAHLGNLQLRLDPAPSW